MACLTVQPPTDTCVTYLQINVPSSAYFYLSQVRSLPWICVTSLRNCEIWLQIKPNLDVSVTFDAGESKSMLEIRSDSLSFVVKLNLLIAEVQCNFIVKTT